MNVMIKNEVVIIGGNHHNMLGIIRMLGEKGIYSNAIIINSNRYAFVKKSKYLKKFDIIEENEKIIIELLLKKYINENYKTILIPSSDFAESLIDANYDELKNYFIIPNIDNKANKVNYYMNKYVQYELCKNNNIKMAQTWRVDIQDNNYEFVKYKYPCILKPINSVGALKGDITICKNIEELKKAINKFKKLQYKFAVLQEYINFDQEYGLIGCCHDKKVILPGIIKKQRIYPEKKGNVSYGLIDNINNAGVDLKPIFKLLKKLNYSGMFDIEIFIKNKNFYLNEINFRNSGNSYAYVYSNIYIIYLWILMILNIDTSTEKKAISKSYYFQDETLEISQLIHKKISLKTYVSSFKNSKVYFVLNKSDIIPVVYKFIYAFLRRLCKNGK